MIQSVSFINHKNELLKLELSNPWEVGMAVSKIDGLGPVESDINITNYGSLVDGGYFNSARAGSRNITISLIFLDYLKTIEEIRHETYMYFPLKQKLKIIVETDKRVSETEGYVESNDPQIFSSREGCQISILCPSPWFYDSINDCRISLKSIEDGFKFPFSNNVHPRNAFMFEFKNNSLDENKLQFYDSNIEKYLHFGEIGMFREKNLRYKGEVTTGVVIRLIAHGDVKNPIIKNDRTGEYMVVNTEMLKILTGNGFMNSDEIVLNTMKGSKSITLLRDGEETNILNCLDPKTSWISILQGDNLFSYASESGSENLEIEITAKFVYEGV